MTRLFFAVILAIVFNIRGAAAQQDIAWVQIEALPSLTAAEERVRAYAGRLPDVNGFSLGGGWYGVVLGPYTGADAERVLNVYRTESEIPRDSFIAYSSAFQQQFWPVGANLLNLPLAGQATALAQPQQEPQATQPQAENSQVKQTPAVADETPRQARESEAQLSREDRMQLQVMLQWAGFYDGGIDGAFGRGTRGSMAAWQQANGFEASGILTTLQRAALKKQYNAVLEGLGLQTVADTTAGIEMQMPMGVVAFSKYSPPFVHYDARGDGPARVLLISQEGDQNTLYGLYDIMQTLEIVPENGERERKGDSFVLTGQNDRIVSYTEAELKGGEIKGFTLIWAAGDEERRQRLLSEMRSSFKRLDGVMSPAEGADEVQSIDLVSGLEIRRPKLSRSGFFVDRNGTVVTTADAVAQCDRITLEDEYEARVVYTDAARGVAVLRAAEPLAPGAVAALRQGDPRLQSEIAVSGYSYGGVLGAPTLTFGTLSDVKGLSGEAELKRLALNALPGDAGGPVFDDGGAVMGMLLPADQGGRKLPGDVSFAMDSASLRAVLDAAGVTAEGAGPRGQIDPEDLNREAVGMTVLVSCW